MERLTPKQLTERMMQRAYSIGERDSRCSRPLCRRNRLCIPPRDEAGPLIYRCPYDSNEHWESRKPIARKFIERAMKVYHEEYKRRGMPSPFAPKQPAHLDLTKPLDLEALFPSPDGRRIVPVVDAGDGVPDLQSLRRLVEGTPAERRRARS